MNLARAVGAAIRGVGVFGIVFGFVVVLGGDQRMSSPAFMFVRATADLVDCSPSQLWGISVAVAGLLVLVHRTQLLGLYLVALWCLLFGMAAFISAVQHPDASVTGPMIYGFVAVMISGLIGVRWTGLAPSVRSSR